VRTYPAARVQTQAVAKAAAQLAKVAAVKQFGAEFSLAGAQAWVQGQVVGRLGSLTDGVWSQIKGVTSGLNSYTDQVVGSFQALRGGLSDLVRAPADLAGAMRDLFALPDEIAAGTGAAFQAAYQSVFGLGSKTASSDFETVVQPTLTVLAMYGQGAADDLYVSTDARQQLDRLNGATDRLVNALAIASWVEAVAADELAGYDQVMAQRRWLYDSCTDLLKGASSSVAAPSQPGANWHDAVLQMLTTAQADMMARGADRARLSAYTPRVCMSIWQLSYLLYGTADWADEIMAMNPHIVHPLLVPAGKALRVVQHG
jgi:prophage DNA circulation protein